jgi:protein involved in polysaccharide export with SLBB domain
MTLLRAIALAGGLTEWANRKSVTVLQTDRSLQNYNLVRIVAGKDDDPRLRGGEVVIVKRRFL